MSNPSEPAKTQQGNQGSATDLKEQQQIEKQRQKQQSSAYLNNLLKKHQGGLGLSERLAKQTQLQIEQQILGGVYSIKKRQWSAQEQKLKHSRTDSHRLNADNQTNRKMLQDQLQFVEGEIGESTSSKNLKPIPEEERLAFMKKMEKEKKELQKKKQQQLKQQEQIRAEQEKKLKEKSEKEQQQRKEKLKQEIEERMKQVDEKKRRKQQENKAQTALLKQKMKEKTMLDKMQQIYNKHQNQSLEQRKKRLAEIRSLHKPIDPKEIQSHIAKLQQIQAERQSALEDKEKLQQRLNKETPIFYQSAFYKKIKEEPKVFIDKRNQQQVHKLRQARDKNKKFSQYISTTYKPTIDQKKAEEIKFRSVNLKKRSMSSSTTTEESHQKKGLRYLQYSKMQANHRLLGSGAEKTEQEQEDKEKDKKQDYLQWLREQNKNRNPQSAQALLNRLQRTNISKEEKAKKIIEFTQRLEKKAKQRQSIQKYGNGHIDDELDGLYLEAIQAKLGLLDQL